MEKDIKIYVIFSIKGTQPSSQTYSLHHPDEKVFTNEEILQEIKKLCTGVEFLGKTEPENLEYTIGNIHGQKENLDGVLYFGHLPDELLSLNLPTIAVHPLWGRWQYPYNSYKLQEKNNILEYLIISRITSPLL